MADDRRKDPGVKVDVKVVDRRSRSLRAAGADPDPDDSGAGLVTDEAPGAEGAGSDRRLPSYVEELKGRAEEAERRFQEVLAAHRQTVVDQEEFRKRLNRDLERRVETEIGGILAGLVAVYDDLDRAVRHAEETRSEDQSPMAQALVSGVSLVRDRFLSVLRERGVEKLDVVNAPFDPQVAEALRTVDVPPEKDGLVLEEISPGFSYRGTVIRPARVTVGRASGS